MSWSGWPVRSPWAEPPPRPGRCWSSFRRAGVLDGYLENQLFSPAVVRGKDILWSRGAALTGAPFLARAAEEHSGPHMPWFWEGSLQGGGVLNDMMCHSVEVARHLLTPPGYPRETLTPVKITAQTSCLKWQQPHYAEHPLAEQRGIAGL